MFLEFVLLVILAGLVVFYLDVQLHLQQVSLISNKINKCVSPIIRISLMFT